MMTVIIGHRGVGKTQLLKRLHRYSSRQGTPCVDLDLEIEKKTQKSVVEIFAKDGEAAFRDLEKHLFQDILAAHPANVIISVGAGFPVGLIPENAKVLWVRRHSDAQGRIFLDRPRLEADLPPLEEYQKRARARELHFKNIYDKIYLMPEGLQQLDYLEEEILVKKNRALGGALTVLPELFFRRSRWHSFIENYAHRGVEFFEIRDDLLSREQVQIALGSFFSERFIYSFRSSNYEHFPNTHQILYYDWPLEMGPLPQPIRFLKQRLIASLHDRLPGESLEDAAIRLQQEAGKVVHLKFAPMIDSFEDLLAGFLWQQEDSPNRSFLPRSPDGRWNWFRCWMKGRQLLNFWRDGEGTSPDQPTLYEWLATPLVKSNFAAVLGSPVNTSWTPVEQRSFFEERGEPVFAIRVDKREWDMALRVLTRLGLRHAAVTAPLKEEAFHSCAHRTEEAELLRSVNTLLFENEKQQWFGQNTDLAGFRAVAQELASGTKVAIWGGGGTLRMMKKVVPQALSFSASRGEVREEDRAGWTETFRPEVVIWAAPRKPDLKWPPSEWQPKKIIDLNYAEDSAGREYAQKVFCEYLSGAKMFEVQAQHQRDFWETHP